MLLTSFISLAAGFLFTLIPVTESKKDKPKDPHPACELEVVICEHEK